MPSPSSIWRRGDVVVDVGCGTGLCFGALEGAVGPGGQIIAIDESPEMLAEARKRIVSRGWENVVLVEAPAQRAEIPARADAALFCAVHDILRSPAALHNVLAGLRPGARVVATGGQWAAPWWPGLNLAVWWQHAPFVRSFEGFDCPWSHLTAMLSGVRVQDVAGGTGYLLVGTVGRNPSKLTSMRQVLRQLDGPDAAKPSPSKEIPVTSTVWTRIDNLATHDAVFVPPQTPLRQVADLMAERSIGAVLVGHPHRLLGIVSERDLVAALAAGADPDQASAAGAMSADVVSLRPADRLYDAAVHMLDLGIRHVPVVDEFGTVEGIVSIRDLLRPLLVRSLEG